MKTDLPSSQIRPVPSYLPSLESSHNAWKQSNASPPDDVEFREYLKVVLKYRMLILSTIVLSTVGALIYAFTVTPYYVATSRIKIGTYEPILSGTKVEDVLQSKSRENNYIDTQLEEMKSFSLADRILQDPEVKSAFESLGETDTVPVVTSDDPEMTSVVHETHGYKNTVKSIRNYLNAIDVKSVKRTSIVTVDATSKDPSVAALIANKHATTYIDWVRSSRIEQQARGLTFLRAQADELREKVADIERELADYAEAHAIVAINKDENITVQKMSQLNVLLTSAIAKKIEAENLYKEAQEALKSPSAGFDDASTNALRAELARLEGQYGELSQKFTASYPKMKQLQSQIAEMKRSLGSQRAQIALGYKAKAQAAAEEEARLKEELEKQKSQTYDLSKKQVQYNVLNRELTSSRELLQNVIKQIKETSLAVESNATNVSIVDLAVVPTHAAYPRKRVFILIAIALGTVLGASIAFFLNYLDNTIRTPEELTAVVHVATLGVVPSFDYDERERKRRAQGTSEEIVPLSHQASLKPIVAGQAQLPIAFLKDSRSLISEAYRTIRTGLLLSQAGEPPRTILVSSAQSSEGKTTSSVNIAVCLASAGGRVVIIDADLRRPSLYTHFNINPDAPGIVEVIAGLQTVDDVIVREPIKRVSVIPCGRIPPNPAELLGSLEMATLIDRLSTEYDYVIIDSPPILPVTDSVILSRYVDGVVLVVKAGETPKKVLKDAKHRLQAVGARFLGAVLNNVDVGSGEYRYYNRYYYSYYKKESERHGEQKNSSGSNARVAS
jgi:succinoglycan biosynthesis transport protein ExoP